LRPKTGIDNLYFFPRSSRVNTTPILKQFNNATEECNGDQDSTLSKVVPWYNLILDTSDSKLLRNQTTKISLSLETQARSNPESNIYDAAEAASSVLTP